MTWFCEGCDIYFVSAFPACPWCGATSERGETHNLQEVIL